jgi:hypothetical protein
MGSAAFSVRFMLATIIAVAPFTAYAADLPTQLRIDHSLRFRHHTITIDFAETDGTVTAHVKTRHSQADIVPEIDKAYTLTSSQSQKLRQLFSRLDLAALRGPDDVGMRGLDGENWYLTYRNEDKVETIKRWTPYSSAEERGLTDCVALFRFALAAVGFDPETSLPRAQ